VKILHYSLGFPPYRTGGLTKFCMDLMKQQLIEGHHVSLLWPGEMKILDKKTKIRYTGIVSGIKSFELKNPNPVSYDEGIRNIQNFVERGEIQCYENFLKEMSPDIIHIHTLMGIHKNLLIAAKKQNIRIVFSAHDFFPICPKVTMFRNGQSCKTVKNCSECSECNLTALADWKIRVLQSPLYRMLKDTSIVKKVRKNHRNYYLNENDTVGKEKIKKHVDSSCYMQLRGYYNSVLNLVDIIHFNSTVTRAIYEKYMNISKSEIISITHSDITEHKTEKKFENNLRFTYLGPQSQAKGYYLLKQTLDRLWAEGKRFTLNIYFEPIEYAPYMNVHGRYTYNELETIFNETDILIAPSVLYETFGYTVLEALSFGVPVVISKNVGAKDILPGDCGIVVETLTSDVLADILRELTPEKLSEMNQSIIQKVKLMTLSDMSSEILHKCYIQ